VIAWINGRNNAVSGLFFLLAFYFYLRQKGQHRRLFSILSLNAFFFSLLSKEYAFIFPLIILIYEMTFGNTSRAPLFQIGATTLRRCRPYLMLVVAYLLLRSWVLPSHGMMDFQPETIWFRILTVPKVVFYYVRLMILPVDLNAFYDVSLIRHLLTMEFLLYGAFLFGLMFFWMWSYSTSKSVFFGIGWILITLLPVLNIVPLAYPESFISEHYMYLPVFGFCILIARLTTYLLPIQSSVVWKYGILLLLLVAVEQYGFETAKRNLVWLNELTLWSDTVVKSPRNFRVRCNLSIALHAAGRADEAIVQIHEAIRLKPAHDTPYFIFAVLLFDAGRIEQSEKALDKVLSINPGHQDALNLRERIRKRQRDRFESM